MKTNVPHVSLIENISPTLLDEINDSITPKLDKCGLFYRIFSRKKNHSSIEKKFEIKNYSLDKKMQDLFGLRIVLYFSDDIDICCNIIENYLDVLEVSKDDPDENTFCPTRLNYVCKIPDHIKKFPQSVWQDFPIDDTFEIQVRTTFSEGWHEVEHDLRYKCRPDWDDNKDLSRNLNGILATVETCDWALINIFEELAYRKYRNKSWEAMIRNRLRIRMTAPSLSEKLTSIFSDDEEIAKGILRMDRKKLLLFLSHPKVIAIPRSLDNMVFCLNELHSINSKISDITPDLLQEQIAKYRVYINGSLE